MEQLQKTQSIQHPNVVGSTLESETTTPLSSKETRKIVTPYAFFVADDLLGTPLAGPFRRGFGMLIDLFCISLLAQASSWVLACVAALTFFKAGNRLKTKKRFNGVRIALRILVAILMFIVVIGVLEEFSESESTDTPTSDSFDVAIDSNADENNNSGANAIEVMALTAKYLVETKELKQQVSQQQCAPAYDCFKKLGEELTADMQSLQFNESAVNGALESYLAVLSESLSDDELTRLSAHLKQTNDINPVRLEEEQPIPEPVLKEEKSEQTEEKFDFIAMLQDIADELGLGFGWAIIYFSIFTAWWEGQTPGKKLLGMKVLKLDNQPLNLWESFGRYGGYAAGLATGLTGFLQVFWDPNRQAIQDKISETLVINIRKPKVQFNKEQVEDINGK